jgi:hypothetical protein
MSIKGSFVHTRVSCPASWDLDFRSGVYRYDKDVLKGEKRWKQAEKQYEKTKKLKGGSWTLSLYRER